MRLWMTLGGSLGFLIGIALGLAQDCAWPTVIWRASVAALVSGIILRWWGGVWATSLRQAERERRLATHQTGAAPAAGKART